MSKYAILLLIIVCISCVPKSKSVEIPVEEAPRVSGSAVDAAFAAGLDAYDHQKYAVARGKFKDVIAASQDEKQRRKAMLGLYCIDLMENETSAAQNATLAKIDKQIVETGREDFENVWMLLPYMKKSLAVQRRIREQDLRMKVLQERSKTAEQNLQQSQTENNTLRMKLEQLEQLYMEIQDKKKSIQ